MVCRVRLVLTCALSASLAGCGLQPVYQGGGRGVVAQELSGITVDPVPGKAGWLVRNAVADRLAAMPGGTPRYRLTIALQDSIEGLGVRANDNVTRERRTLRARFQLRGIADDDKAPPLLDDSAFVDAGVDVASSEYATVAAEDTALENLSRLLAERIIARLSLDAARRARQ